MLKSLLLVIMLLAIPLSSSADICFSEEDAAKILMEVEQGRLSVKIISLYEEKDKACIDQVEILKRKAVLFEEKTVACESTLQNQTDLQSEKYESCQTDLKQAKKPRWGSLFSSAGIGAVAAILLILLL